MTKVIVDELYSTVEAHLSKKENVVKLRHSIEDYIDKNTEKLGKLGPVDRTLFSSADEMKLFEPIGLTPQRVKEAMKKSPAYKAHWEVTKKEFNTAAPLALRYFTMKNNDEMARIVLIYFILSMYPARHHRYFRYGVNEQIMQYTINNLSNKYKIKQLGTMLHAIIDTAEVAYKTYKVNIKSGTDKEIVDFINGMHTRLNSLLKNIANEYYENHEKNLYLNSDSDSFEEDNYHIADSNIYAVDTLTQKVVTKLTVSGPNANLVNSAAQSCSVSVNELRNYLNSMITNERRDEIHQVVESLLFLYLFDSKHTLNDIYRNNKFMMYCVEMYKKSNTTDKNIIRIKKILDSWLEDLGTYKKTQRLATINNFRRALFMFFVMAIQGTE